MSQELNGFLSNESNLSGSMNNGANLIGSFIQGGGGGTSDYNDLDNKPSINNVTLSGNKTSHDLGLMPETNLAAVATSGDYDDLIDKPVLAEIATSGDYDDLINKPDIPDMTDYYNKTETDTLLDDKVDQSQINTNVYTNTGSGYRTVTFIRAANKPEIRAMRIGPYYIQSDIDSMLAQKADSSSLAAVATSGDYDDLTNKPVIPFAGKKVIIHKVHLGSTPVTTSAGSLFVSSNKSTDISEYGFTNVDLCIPTGWNATGTAASWVALQAFSPTNINYLIYRHSSMTFSDYYVSFLIIGG